MRRAGAARHEPLHHAARPAPGGGGRDQRPARRRRRRAAGRTLGGQGPIGTGSEAALSVGALRLRGDAPRRPFRLEAGLKRTIVRNPGLGAAVQARIALPMGGEHASVGLAAPLAARLPGAWSLTLNPEVTVPLRSGAADLQGLVTLSRPLSGEIVGLAQVAVLAGSTRSLRFAREWLVGADYTPASNPDWHFGVGAGVGDGARRPRARAYLALSVRL